MKIFHTGDWHIGKLVNGFYMTEDQEFILAQLYDAIRSEKPDVLLIAGDLYDRSVPPVQAIELLNKALSTIVRELDTPVIAIAGNHDSSERLDFGSSLLRDSGLFISGMLMRGIKAVTLQDEFGPVHFYPIPYMDPPIVRELYEDENIKTHDDAMKVILDDIQERMDPRERNIAIAHGYITGMSTGIQADEPVESDSEKALAIGGTASVDPSYFKAFNYTALGHLHGPQRAGDDKIRYSGSLLKYSFSEANQRKGITIVEMDGSGQVELRFHALVPKRDFRILRGELKELIGSKAETTPGENHEDYIRAILTDRGELLDPISKLRSVYPNTMELIREGRLVEAEAMNNSRTMVKNRSELSLFEDFYRDMTGVDCGASALEVVKSVIEEIRKEGDRI